MKSDPKRTFKKLYDEYVVKIYRFIFLKVNSREIAQDLASETFLKFWERLNNNNPKAEIKNPKAFLYQIARNSIVDHYRRQANSVLVPLDGVQIQDPNSNPEKEILLVSDLQELSSALRKIPENYQNLIIWYYLEEFSVPEIAEMLNKPENVIRVTIHRALGALRREMTKEIDDQGN